MSLDIFFSDDIRNALLAANEASAATAEIMAASGGACHSLPRRVSITCSVCGEQVVCVAEDDMADDILRAYRHGFKAALVTVALAFGLAPQALISGKAETHGRIRTDISR